jgi:farnesyl-diphosphate farnesyltransferase
MHLLNLAWKESLMPLEIDATEVLKQTSRTFYVSIVRLPPRIKEAVMSSYLSLRAIDEIEDHARFDKLTKVSLLCEVSNQLLNDGHLTPRLSTVLRAYRNELPEVTNRLDEWIRLAPKAIAPCIWDATSAMARRMAYWVDNDWRISTKRDLDRYTFSVAGAVGVLLSDLWTWYDGTPSSKADAIGYGRGLQAVNILRNRPEDLARGVNFFPDGWTWGDFQLYARTNLSRGDAYVRGFPPGPAQAFCHGPQTLAHATLEALDRGESKLSRKMVMELMGLEGGFPAAEVVRKDQLSPDESLESEITS